MTRRRREVVDATFGDSKGEESRGGPQLMTKRRSGQAMSGQGRSQSDDKTVSAGLFLASEVPEVSQGQDASLGAI